MGSRGDAYDNAVAEAFFKTLKHELIDRQSWPTRAEARTAVFEFIQAFYNRERLHSTLGYLSPSTVRGNVPHHVDQESCLAPACPPNRGTPVEATVALLLIAPAVLGYLLVRPSEHVLVGGLLAGVRRVVISMGFGPSSRPLESRSAEGRDVGG